MKLNFQIFFISFDVSMASYKLERRQSNI